MHELSTHVADCPVRPDRHNPLACDAATAGLSSYLGVGPDGLTRLLEPDRPPEAAERQVHAALRDKVLGAAFPCVAARSAFNRLSYRFGRYPQMGTEASARAVCHDLYEFSRENPPPADGFSTFIAVFDTSRIDSELDFEQRMWQQLQRMHDADAEFFDWSPSVSSDPRSERFSFSIGARAYFLVGLHPHASRLARRTPWPVIVFNLHEQFEQLREGGKYESMKRAIRSRDLAYQGSLNPVLSNFGEKSEALQYSGRAVGDDWRCPFHTVRPT